MKTEPPKPAAEGAPPSTPSQAGPLDIIRTETVLSKLPIHNLSKTGLVNIQIARKGPNGQIELKWEVSYSDRYGQARQLAYKIDTLIIDQRIEEAGKPLPERIRLGSLHEICKDLGSTEGRNKNRVRRAFLQNASAFITAKLKYRSNDGTERTFEAGFTRYSVVFTGDKFPDGSKADAVYITLNPDYRDVLNNAPFRPLDLAYKKQLSPTAQRFYEIVSYKIYAALKYNQPVARLTYSEYCTFSAQQRYFDYEHFKKQMYKIHRPHLASGYIAKVHFEQTTDEQGKADWTMCYEPGPKARAEYATFTGKIRASEGAAAPSSSPAGDPGGPRQPRQRRLNLAPPTEPERPSAAPVDRQIITELARRGIGETDARQILGSLPPDHPVLDLLEYGDYLIGRKKRGRIENPPGFYISLLHRKVPIPESFISTRKAKEIEAANLAQRIAVLERQEAAFRAEEEERLRVDAQIDALPEERRQALFHQAMAQLLANQPNMIHFFKTAPDKAMQDGSVRSKMRQIFTRG
jgi:hypothetical protein